MTESKRLEYAAFALRKHVEDETGCTYGMEDTDHPNDERVQAFRAVWRAFKRTKSEEELAQRQTGGKGE